MHNAKIGGISLVLLIIIAIGESQQITQEDLEMEQEQRWIAQRLVR
tara:strand:+ start:160 stop:297 length:138 start_codon:yes stop_codon:yes gene_type:complete